jgi:membrane associated rhomboid family serine protease
MFPIRSAVPYRYAPIVTWAVIVANCVVFLAQTSLDPADLQALVYAFGLVPARYLGLFSGGSGGPRLVICGCSSLLCACVGGGWILSSICDFSGC